MFIVERRKNLISNFKKKLYSKMKVSIFLRNRDSTVSVSVIDTFNVNWNPEII